MKSTIFGSALTLLLAFSVISYSKTFIQRQDPKPVQVQQPVALDVAGQVPEVHAPAVVPETALAASPAESPANLSAAVSDSAATSQTYTATAYSLHGRTASGKPVSRGLIAADPAVLPLGTRVRLDAGSWSGEYLVADTGGAVKGRRIDIWTPTTREALQFGRRPVRLTVLELGGRRAQSALVRPRKVNDPAPAIVPATRPAARQDK